MPTHSTNELTPLPFEVQYIEEESGLGYLLRCLSSNHISLSWLKTKIGIKGYNLPNAKNAIELSYLTGLDYEKLRKLLFQSFGSKSKGGILIYGQQILVKELYRFKNPQICPNCLHQKYFIDQGWEFALPPICVEHRIYLTDICQNCNRTIRWDRPSIDICQCGRIFSTTKNNDNPSDEEIKLSKAILIKLKDRNEDDEDIFKDLPIWIKDLSLDAALRLITAFGFFENPDQIFSYKPGLRRMKTQEWERCFQRAAFRLKEFKNSSNREGLSKFIYQSFIQQIAINPVNSVDKEIALYLLKDLFNYDLLSHFASSKGHLSQQRLFD